MKKTFKFEISKFKPCSEALKFRTEYDSFEEAWNACPRGDWMLWLAQKLDVDLQTLTSAKALCANTVRHLMRDERSIKAIDVALLFGKGLASNQELEDAAAAAYDAAYAAYAAAYAAYAAYAAATAAAYAAYAANTAADAADAAAYDAADDTAASAAKIENELETANICREILTEIVFKQINKLKNESNNKIKKNGNKSRLFKRKFSEN